MSTEGASLFGSRAMLRLGAWLDALLPDSLRAAFHPAVPLHTIALGDDGSVTAPGREVANVALAGFTAPWLGAQLSPWTGRPALLRTPITLRLPPAVALERKLTLPLAARARLRDILRHELGRQSPIDPGEVYFDYRCEVGETLDVSLRIVRREAVDRLLGVCRAAGVAIAEIGFSGDRVPATGSSFPVDPAAAALLTLRRRQVPILATLVLVLAVAVLAGACLRQQAAGAELEVRLEKTRGEVQQVLALEREIAGVRQRTAFLAAEKHKPLLLDVIAEATRVLPQGSWLSELQMHGREVEMTGYSNSASALIARFDASPLFADAQFRSPLVKVQGSDAERFELSVTLRTARRR